MATSIVDQNKSLSSAGKTPKDTTHRNVSATRYAAKISSSKRESDQAVTGVQQQVTRSSGKQIKGSYEGLMHTRSTVLQFRGAGYDSSSNHQARYNKSFPIHGKFQLGSFTSNKNYSIMNNYSTQTISGSSSDRLSSIVKNNMMF